MVKDKYFPDIWKNRKVRVSYTLFHNIFEVFEEENCPNKNIYHTFALFSKKSEESIEDTINNLLILLKRPEDISRKILMILRKHPAFSQFHLEKPNSFVGDSFQTYGITKEILVHYEKYANAFVFNGSLLYKGFPTVGGGAEVGHGGHDVIYLSYCLVPPPPPT